MRPRTACARRSGGGSSPSSPPTCHGSPAGARARPSAVTEWSCGAGRGAQDRLGGGHRPAGPGGDRVRAAGRGPILGRPALRLHGPALARGRRTVRAAAPPRDGPGRSEAASPGHARRRGARGARPVRGGSSGVASAGARRARPRPLFLVRLPGHRGARDRGRPLPLPVREVSAGGGAGVEGLGGLGLAARMEALAEGWTHLAGALRALGEGGLRAIPPDVVGQAAALAEGERRFFEEVASRVSEAQRS